MSMTSTMQTVCWRENAKNKDDEDGGEKQRGSRDEGGGGEEVVMGGRRFSMMVVMDAMIVRMTVVVMMTRSWRSCSRETRGQSRRYEATWITCWAQATKTASSALLLPATTTKTATQSTAGRAKG